MERIVSTRLCHLEALTYSVRQFWIAIKVVLFNSLPTRPVLHAGQLSCESARYMYGPRTERVNNWFSLHHFLAL